MAKRRFAKSIIKNNPFKKLSAVFISLVLLFILSIVLYFVFNKYTVENFVARDDPKIVIGLWTDDNRSLGNSFVTNEWVHVVAHFNKFATFKKGTLTDFVAYARDIARDTKIEALFTDANIEEYKKVWRPELPFVTCQLLVNNRFVEEAPQAFFSRTHLTSHNISKYITTYSSMYYNELYTTSSNSSNSSTPQQVTDATNAVNTAQQDANNANNANYP